MKGQSLRNWYRVPLAIFALGILSTVLLIVIKTVSESQRACASFSNEIREIQLDVALVHLYLEESLAGESNADPIREIHNLQNVIERVEKLIAGNSAKGPVNIPPLRDPELRRQFGVTHGLLVEFKAMAEGRMLSPTLSGYGTRMDDQFDTVFRRILDTSLPIEQSAEAMELKSDVFASRLFVAVLVLWGVAIAITVVSFYRMERQRVASAEVLREARDELESRVSERTRELTEANQSLERQISERELVEEALRASESDYRRISLEFRTLLDAIPDTIFLLSRDYRILYANRGAVEMTGISAERLTGQVCHEVLWGGDGVCEQCMVGESMLCGAPRSRHLVVPDGRVLDARAFPIHGEDGQVLNVLEVVADITEKTAMESEAMRTAHLASLGELAAGVAHEVNNPINGIINYAQILLNTGAPGSEQTEISERIIREGGRIANIVKGLLSFARERPDTKEDARVEQLIKDALLLTESQLRKSAIAVRIDIPPDLPPIVANAQQIQQVFLNVVSNARYALNQKYPCSHPEKVLEITCTRDHLSGNGAVGIVFLDHGCGIPASILGRVRIPFFTTKPPGQGTGLGLAISHGIVNDHGGRLAIESVEGGFTRVEILLPAKGQA